MRGFGIVHPTLPEPHLNMAGMCSSCSIPRPSHRDHCRCLWRIIQNEFQPQSYGLPEAPWNRHIVIFSLALNFWAPDGIHFTTKLLDASLTECDTDGNGKVTGIGPTRYFLAEENRGLQNSFQEEVRVYCRFVAIIIIKSEHLTEHHRSRNLAHENTTSGRNRTTDSNTFRCTFPTHEGPTETINSTSPRLF